MQSLLDRMRQHPQKREVTAKDVGDSILKNISRVLQSTRGSVSTRPDMGLEPMNFNLIDKQTLHETASSITTQIEAFESRLQKVNVNVSHQTQDDALKIQLDIEGQYDFENKKHPLKFNISVLENGFISLQVA